MTNRRRTATLAGVAAVAGGAATATVFALLPAGAASTANSSAYGIAGSGSVPISQHGAASSTDGATHNSTESSYTSSDQTVKATGIRSTATAYAASSNVASVSYINGLLKISSAYANCSGGKVSGGGSVSYDQTKLSKVTVAKGHTTKNSDGSVTVTGVIVTVHGAGGNAETLNVASATCAAKPGTKPTKPTPTHTTNPTQSPTSPTQSPTSTESPTTGPTAPAPTATTTHLPVTG
jgi:hypothetical protein